MMKAFATRHIIGERYDSMGEFVNVLRNRDYSPYYKRYVDDHKDYVYCDQMRAQTGIGDSRVDAGESLDMAAHGTDMFDGIMAESALQSFAIESDDLELDVKRPVNSIVGSSPNVGRFIAGQPNCMRRRVKRDYSVRRNVRIIYTLDAPQFIRVEKRVEYGLMLINALKVLQANGYSIEFSIGYACGNPGQGLTYLLEIPMKTFNTVFDVRKMIWPVAGASGLFHIGRNWQQKLPVGAFMYRLGVSAWNDKEQRKVMKRFFERENTVWMNMDIIASLVSASNGVDADGNIMENDDDGIADMSDSDAREGLRRMVDFIIDEKEIDVNHEDDGDGDLMLVNRYQQPCSDADMDVDDIWKGVELANADPVKRRRNRPLDEKTRILITGMVDRIDSNAVDAGNLNPTAVDDGNVVKVSWWTLRMNSFRNWWRHLFGDVGNAFDGNHHPQITAG